MFLFVFQKCVFIFFEFFCSCVRSVFMFCFACVFVVCFSRAFVLRNLSVDDTVMCVSLAVFF